MSLRQERFLVATTLTTTAIPAMYAMRLEAILRTDFVEPSLRVGKAGRKDSALPDEVDKSPLRARREISPTGLHGRVAVPVDQPTISYVAERVGRFGSSIADEIVHERESTVRLARNDLE